MTQLQNPSIPRSRVACSPARRGDLLRALLGAALLGAIAAIFQGGHPIGAVWVFLGGFASVALLTLPEETLPRSVWVLADRVRALLRPSSVSEAQNLGRGPRP